MIKVTFKKKKHAPVKEASYLVDTVDEHDYKKAEEVARKAFNLEHKTGYYTGEVDCSNVRVLR